ncbi:MAG: AbrB/MazE/SpoVT family DNA-binding domain-containing protein [Myxococcales bacterium]|nr:AbrB/MazE/SpoVT family DNA-binding domain-containing protein [Myxococcales bacterium]
MARVTSKLQVTVPKVIAEQFAIHPGDEIDWVPAGDGIRVVKRAPAQGKLAGSGANERLRLFDEATKRREQSPKSPASSGERAWTREELYDRGRVG